MRLKYGFIIAAGNQSRFKSSTPKALAKIGDKTLLDINIGVLSKYCDKVYTVISKEACELFKGYDVIAIDSGKGSGDAVAKALKEVNLYSMDNCIISWGDSLINEEVVKLIRKAEFSHKVVVPCEVSDDPYVGIVSTDNSSVVKFKKYGENTVNMYHDLSIFGCNCSILQCYMNEFIDKYLVNDSYTHKHGNEFEFLDIFNETKAVAELVETDSKVLSFNTLEELEGVVLCMTKI